MADLGLPINALLGESLLPVSSEPVRSAAAEERCLIEDLKQGREEAYETLIVNYQQPVYNLICRLLGDPSEAPDIVQEVFLKVFRNIGRFRADSCLRTWIYRIAVNEAYNHRRWFARHQRQEVGMTREEGRAEESFADRGRTPFDLASDSETRAMIDKALAQVSLKFRTAVILRDIDELSYEEIASVMGVSLGTVKSRIVRGREALRKILAGGPEADAALAWPAQAFE